MLKAEYMLGYGRAVSRAISGPLQMCERGGTRYQAGSTQHVGGEGRTEGGHNTHRSIALEWTA